MEENKDLFDNLLSMPVATPTQTIVKVKEKVEESKITYWTQYHQKLKMLAVMKKTSVKQLLDDAVLEKYGEEFKTLNL